MKIKIRLDIRRLHNLLDIAMQSEPANVSIERTQLNVVPLYLTCHMSVFLQGICWSVLSSHQL